MVPVLFLAVRVFFSSWENVDAWAERTGGSSFELSTVARWDITTHLYLRQQTCLNTHAGMTLAEGTHTYGDYRDMHAHQTEKRDNIVTSSIVVLFLSPFASVR